MIIWIDLYDEITGRGGRAVDIVYLDFRKAFGIVSYKVLINKHVCLRSKT